MLRVCQARMFSEDAEACADTGRKLVYTIHRICSGLDDFPQRYVEHLDGIGRINRLANIIGKTEHGNDSRPVRRPRLHNRGIARVPLFSERRIVLLGFRGDLLQVAISKQFTCPSPKSRLGLFC